MKPFASSLLALLLLVGGCKEAAQQSAGYHPEQAGTVDQAMCLLGFVAVPLRQVASGHQLVDATLNGRPARFVVDTGANQTVLNVRYTADYGIAPGSPTFGPAVGFGGPLQARQVSIDSLKLGSVAIRRGNIMTADLSQLTDVLAPLSGGRIAGVIGQDVLQDEQAVIDTSRPVLYLRAERAAPLAPGALHCGSATNQHSLAASSRPGKPGAKPR